ncbi:MAG: hypothetical protein UHL07_07680, partial [Bacteroidaceae bacterium]|nr:hypothetical protein [Bacteroidaceae bacterium]
MMVMLAFAASPSVFLSPRVVCAEPDSLVSTSADSLSKAFDSLMAVPDSMDWDDSLSAGSYAARKRARSLAKDSVPEKRLTVDSVLSTFTADTISE